MLKRTFLLIFMSLTLVACQDINKSEKPNDLIPEDKMVDLIAEISIVQSARNFNKRIFENTGVKWQKYIFEKYDIDSLQFKRSNDYYAENYVIYQRIYDSVKARFERMKVALDTLQQQEQRLKDSIIEAKQDSIRKMGDSLSPVEQRQIQKMADSIVKEKSINRKFIDSLSVPVSRN